MAAAAAPLVALVSGGSRGLGLQIAAGLARRGARVCVLSRCGEAAGQAAATLHRPGGWRGQEAAHSAGDDDTARWHIGLACDVGEPAAVDRAVAAAVEALGPPNVLVNAAGVSTDSLLVRSHPSHRLSLAARRWPQHLLLPNPAAQPLGRGPSNRLSIWGVHPLTRLHTRSARPMSRSHGPSAPT